MKKDLIPYNPSKVLPGTTIVKLKSKPKIKPNPNTFGKTIKGIGKKVYQIAGKTAKVGLGLGVLAGGAYVAGRSQREFEAAEKMYDRDRDLSYQVLYSAFDRDF